MSDKEEQIIEEQYQQGTQWLRDEYYCPHTTNPWQVKSCCNRCILLEILQINVYRMTEMLGNDWATSVMGFISDNFKTRQEAEQWALNKHFREIRALGYAPTNYKITKVDTG